MTFANENKKTKINQRKKEQNCESQETGATKNLSHIPVPCSRYIRLQESHRKVVEIPKHLCPWQKENKKSSTKKGKEKQKRKKTKKEKQQHTSVDEAQQAS